MLIIFIIHSSVISWFFISNKKSFIYLQLAPFFGSSITVLFLLPQIFETIYNDDKQNKRWLWSRYNWRWVGCWWNFYTQVSKYKKVGMELSSGELMHSLLNIKPVSAKRDWKTTFQKECDNLGLDAFYRNYIHKMQRSYLSIILVVQVVVTVSHIVVLLIANLVSYWLIPHSLKTSVWVKYIYRMSHIRRWLLTFSSTWWACWVSSFFFYRHFTKMSPTQRDPSSVRFLQF